MFWKETHRMLNRLGFKTRDQRHYKYCTSDVTTNAALCNTKLAAWLIQAVGNTPESFQIQHVSPCPPCAIVPQLLWELTWPGYSCVGFWNMYGSGDHAEPLRCVFSSHWRYSFPFPPSIASFPVYETEKGPRAYETYLILWYYCPLHPSSMWSPRPASTVQTW